MHEKITWRYKAAHGPRRGPFIRITNIVGIILCVLFLPGFIVNATLLISSIIHPDTPPNFMGYTPLLVESGSMTPFFSADDLVIIRNGTDNTTYENGTVICFKSENSYVTHRIVKVTSGEDGEPLYTTQGDANNTPDTQTVRTAQILGSYATHIRGFGGTLMFIQTPTGMICCILLPLFLLFLLFYIPPKVAAQRKKRKRPSEGVSIY